MNRVKLNNLINSVFTKRLIGQVENFSALVAQSLSIRRLLVNK
jgi:hypothetical protein